MKNTQNFTEGRIFAPLIRFALPVLAASAVARLMRAPVEAFDKTVSYITICSAGTVFIVAFNLVGSIFRGMGNSTLPLLTVAIACVVNIAGDLLLVAVFHLGTAGVAIATVFAQAVSVAVSLAIIRRQKLLFAFDARDIRPRGRYIRQIITLGAPIALQDLLVNISFLTVTAIVNTIGLTASAGVGVAEKLCGFIMLVPSSYMQAMSAFVAQNVGAGKPQRARKALLCGIASSLAVGVVMAYANFFHGDIMSGLFAVDPDVIAASLGVFGAWDIISWIYGNCRAGC